MSTSAIEHLARGRFSFLRPQPAEIRRILPQADVILPTPQQIFLEDEDAEPLSGYPVLRSPKLRTLEQALVDYLRAEEEVQFAFHKREPFDSRAYASRWECYRAQLASVLRNVTLSSRGGDYPAIFWLHHSLAVSRYIQEIPRRLRRLDLAGGRDHGDSIKYQVFSKWADRAVALHRDVVRRLADEMVEEEEALFPALLTVMRENELIFTEDYVSPDLSELQSYFQARLQQDGRELRHGLERLEEWHRENLEADSVLRGAVVHLLGDDLRGEFTSLPPRPGYLRFLTSLAAYSPEHLLSPEQIEVWEDLLPRLQRFEILSALRKLLVPIEAKEGALVARHRSPSATWVGGPSVLHISHATRPIDFTSTWVVDPVVQRYGLVYDITDFSAILSRLGRAEKKALEEAFRMTSAFQRRVNKIASSLKLGLEKYLGDGAFYSGRNARRMLAAAIQIQRLYPEFLKRGFPFDSGLRIALNFGEYRLLPLAGDPKAAREIRYEFFGHGLVELSRLSTGKRTQEIDDFKTYLVAQGYPEQVVNKFFAPMTSKSSELVSKVDQERRFYAYINDNGALVNEGIVATEAFISRLGEFPRMGYARVSGRGFIALEIEEGENRLRLGLRKLGIGKFKGLEPVPVYEVVDGSGWLEEPREIPEQPLTAALDRLFLTTVTGQGGR